MLYGLAQSIVVAKIGQLFESRNYFRIAFCSIISIMLNKVRQNGVITLFLIRNHL